MASFVLTLRDRYSNDLSSKNIYVPKLKLVLRVAAPPPPTPDRPMSASPSRRRLSEAVAAAAEAVEGRPAAEAGAAKAEAEEVAASWCVPEQPCPRCLPPHAPLSLTPCPAIYRAMPRYLPPHAPLSIPPCAAIHHPRHVAEDGRVAVRFTTRTSPGPIEPLSPATPTPP